MEEDLSFLMNVSEPNAQPLISEPKNSLNANAAGISFDLFAYVSENKTSFQSESELVWTGKNLTYGEDSSLRKLQTGIRIPEVSFHSTKP